MVNRLVSNVENQLKQLVSMSARFADSAKPEGQLLAEIMQQVEHLTDYTGRQILVLDTTRAIADTAGLVPGLDELLRTSLNIIQERLGFNCAAIFLVDDGGDGQPDGWAELKATGANPADRALHHPEESGYRVKIDDNSPVGRVISQQQAYFAAGLAPAWLCPAGDETEPQDQSLLVLPLLNRQRAIGALVLHQLGQPAFTQEDAGLLGTLTGQLATLILNAQLFAAADQRMEELVALHNISLQIGTFRDLKQLLASIAWLGSTLLAVDVSIVTTDKESRVFIRRDQLPAIDEDSCSACLNQEVTRTGQAVLAPNWPQHPLFTGAAGPEPYPLAVLNVPILLQGQAIGTIEVQSYSQSQAFDENDLYILSLLASQAAIAIENIRLFNEARNNHRFLKTVMNHIPDPIFIKDKNHTLVEMNEANARVVGLPEEEVIGKTDRDILPPELADRFFGRDEIAFSTNQTIVAEDKTIWADGQEHTAYTRLIPIAGSSGQTEFLLGITNDVTERRAEEAERERLLAETAALYHGSQALARALSERQVYYALFEQIRAQDPCEISAYRLLTVEGEPTWAELKANWRKGQPLEPDTEGPGRKVCLYLPETAQARLLLTHEALFIDDITTDKRLSPAERDSFAASGAFSAAILPLVITGQEIAVIFVYFTRPYTFGEATRRFWQAMVEQAGVALANRQLIQEAAYRAVQMDTAAEVARAASSLLGMNELLEAAVALICDRFNLYYVGIFLLDHSGAWVVLRAGSGEAGRIQLAKGHRLRVGGESMIGWCIEHKQPRIALDVGRDAVHFQNPDLPETRSEMALPLIYRNNAIGALTVQSSEQAAFSRDDIIFLQTMADQLANAIENARLYQAERDRHQEAQKLYVQAQQEIKRRERAERVQESIHAISEAASSVQNLLALFGPIHDSIKELMPADNFYIALYDETSNTLSYPYFIDQYDSLPDPHPPAKGLTEYVLRTGESLLATEETLQHLAQQGQAEPVGTACVDWLGAPLKTDAGRKTIGVMVVQTYEKNQRLGPDDKSILTFVSGQVAMAIERKRAEEALASERNLLRTLVDNVPDYIYVKDRQSRFVLNNIAHAQIVGNTTPAELVGKNDFDYFPREMAQQYYDDEQELMATGKPLFNREEPLVDPDGNRRWMSSTKVPLRDSYGEVIGFVGTTRDITQHRQAEEDNRRLLEEAQYRSSRLQTAAEVSRAASSILDINQLIDTSVNLIRDQFDFYYVGLFLVNDTRDWAVLYAGTGEAGQRQLQKGHKLKIGGGSMIGWAIANRKARIALDVGQEAVRFENPDLPETHSEMALPLTSRDEVIGALTVQSTQRGAFSDEDITLLQTMADHLANAIQNARLFHNVTLAQQTAEELLQETQALHQLSQALAGTLKVDEVLDIFLQACLKEIGFEYVQLVLVEKDQHRLRTIASASVAGQPLKPVNRSLDSRDIMAEIIRSGQTEIISGWDERFEPGMYEAQDADQWIRVYTPISLRQENTGLVEGGFNKNKQPAVQDSHIRLLRAFIDQTALALDSAQRYEASLRVARREALIKEITTRVRASTHLDTILQTAVKEVGDALGGKRAYIQLTSDPNGGTDDRNIG